MVNEFQREFGDVTMNLGQAESRDFVEAFLDSEPNRLGLPFREMLYRQTRGHSLFTIELLRGMQKRGDLVQDQEGRWVEGPALDWETLPARVGAVVVERIGRLAQPLWAALRVASVEGEVFTAEMVARVQATDEREMLGCLSGELDRKHRGLGSLLLLIWGALSLGRSFRMALPESRQPLVTGGLYRWMRNPLALSIDLLTLGILLLAPSWLALLTFALTVVSYEWKIRIEENYLREAHGEAHAEYCARTGRYLPRLSVLVASR